jgi:hypothetical protein
MHHECMAPNGKYRALMLQMNAVARQIDQKVRSLLTLQKFAANRDRAPEPEGRDKRGGPHRKRAMSTKKDIAPYPCKSLQTYDLPKNKPKTNPILIFEITITASSNIRKRSVQTELGKATPGQALPARTRLGWLAGFRKGTALPHGSRRRRMSPPKI